LTEVINSGLTKVSGDDMFFYK